MLGLPYPGGPEVERAARGGDAKRFAFPRPMLGRARRQFLAVGIEDRGSQRGEPARAAGAAGHQRSLRRLPGGGAGIDRRPAERRLAAVSRTIRPAPRAGRRRRRRRQSGDPRRVAGRRRESADHADHSAARALHRQWRDDRLGRRRAAGAGHDRHDGRRRPARAGCSTPTPRRPPGSPTPARLIEWTRFHEHESEPRALLNLSPRARGEGAH